MIINRRKINEIYKDVRDCYEIHLFNDNTSKVYNTISNNYLSLFNNGTGYYQINVYLKNRNRKAILIHRLIMLCFKPIENSDKLEVNHKDLDKSNNKIDNLEWITSKNNSVHVWKNKGNTIKESMSKAKKKDLNIYKKVKKLLEENKKVSYIVKETGISNATIYKIKSNDHWSCKEM